MRFPPYKQIHDGDFLPLHHVHKIACCDCGLVHRWEFKIKTIGRKKVAGFIVARDNRATGQRRRRHGRKKTR